MKLFRLPLVAAVLAGLPALAQPSPGDVPLSQPDYAAARLSLEQLEQLLAPIALYPDALIALILPATTVPTDIVLAARQLRDSPDDRSQIEHRSWDESVKSLTNYAEVLLWLDENLPWTKQVGEAFLVQPAEVMQSIQKLRNQARAAGTLVDTPQQQVITEANVVRIVPAQPDIIYVPRYEPEVVFLPQPVYSRSFITFGVGVGVGSWLAYDCDWNRNTLWMASRHRPWVRPDWRRPFLSSAPHFTHAPIVHQPPVRVWRTPVTHSSRPPSYAYSRSGPIVRPTPFGYSRSQPSTSVPAVYDPPIPSARSYSTASRSLTYGQNHSYDRSHAQTGITPEPSAATRAYARSTLPTVGPRFADPVAPAPVPAAPQVVPANPSGPSGRAYSGSRSRSAHGAPDQSSRQRSFERTAPPSAPQPSMGPTPVTRPASNPTLRQPAASEPAPARRSNRSQPAPAPAASAETPAATAAPTPATPAQPQPGQWRGRSGGDNSNTAPSGGYGGRVGR